MQRLDELAGKADVCGLAVKIEVYGRSIFVELESFEEAVTVFKKSGKIEIADFLISQAIDFIEKYN